MTRGASSGGGGGFLFVTMSAFDTSATESVIMTTLPLCPSIKMQVQASGSRSKRE